MQRGRWLAILIVASTLVFAACGGDDDANNGAGSTPTDETIVVPETTPTRAIPPSPVVTKTSGNLILATTTSTQDSGLLDELVPLFENETGYNVQTVAVGSGQAIEQASRGDADVVLVHSPAAEQQMVADGNGIERALVMHNDYVIAGPADDPAALAAEETLDDVMRAIAARGAAFISRGDDSGTHALERRLWQDVGIDPSGQSWYEETGQGMGATLQIANQRNAYTLSDRGTFLSQQANLDLEVAFEGDPALLNVYHVIVVNPDRYPNVNAAAARAFAAFITRPDIQAVIGSFGVEEFGEPLFMPDAGGPEPAG